MDTAKLQAAKQILQGAQRILIVSHIRPDGDAVGSLLALHLALKDIGKENQPVLEDGIPKPFHHLSGWDKVRKRPEGDFDTIITLDSSDLARTGSVLEGYPIPDINIDHHVTNQHFARVNLVDSEATATAELLTEYLPLFGLTITPPISEALLTGLLTDTLGFRTSNMRPQALRTAAKLMETGIDLPELYRKVLINRSFAATRYWGSGLKTLQRTGRMVWATLSLKDRKEANYPGRDDADLINVLSSIEDTDVAIIFIEQPDEHIKVSWRAKPGFDVAKIAAQFGGGGHKPAAGATIKGNLDTIRDKVLQATHALFNGSVTNP